MEGGDDLLLDDAALPTPSNILYDAYTGGNNSGGTRHDIPICRRRGSAGREHKGKHAQNRGTGRHKAKEVRPDVDARLGKQEEYLLEYILRIFSR